MPTAHPSQRGATLAESLVVLAIAGLAATVAAANLAALRRGSALASSCRRVHALVVRARTLAVTGGAATSLVFERGPHGYRCFVARDGDGDGVNRRDIARGTDELLSPVEELEDRPAGLGILPGVRVPDPSGRGRLRGDPGDPVRAGRGDIVTFTPRSTATPCTIYFTDARERMRAIRVFGPSARVRVLEWRRGWPRWRRAGW